MGKAHVYCLSHHIEILFFKSLDLKLMFPTSLLLCLLVEGEPSVVSP